jgi:hypothetical protein
MRVDSTLKVYALIGYPPREALDLAFSFAPIENLPGNRRVGCIDKWSEM